MAYLTELQRMTLIRELVRHDITTETLIDRLKQYQESGETVRIMPDKAVVCLWKAGLKIEAIKLHRSKHPGRGLKDAKDDCEAVDGSQLTE